MFSRFVTPAFALVFGVAALTSVGCAAPTAATADAPSESVGTTGEALDVSSLIDTATEIGQKAGPVLSVASALYGMYQDIPGKLDAMNAKLDGIAGDTTAIKAQVAVIDTKMDEQFKADFLAPMGAAENYISIDMKNQMTTLAEPGNVSVNEGDWVTITTALNNHLAATDTANQKILEYFVPEGTTASKYTAAQWYSIFGYELRAGLVKVALRDAQATLASTYYDRAPSPEYAARKETAIANLVSTVQNVAPQLRAIGDLYVAARNAPALAGAACFNTNQTYQQMNGADIGGPTYAIFLYQSFRDPGIAYTSPMYTTGTTDLSGRIDWTNQCRIALDKYRYEVLPKIDAFVSANIDAPIASFQAIPGNWAGK